MALIAQYRLNETTGTVVNDAVSGNNGTYVGSPTLGNDTNPFGVPCLKFDGVDDHCLLPQSLNILLASSTWTVSVLSRLLGSFQDGRILQTNDRASDVGSPDNDDRILMSALQGNIGVGPVSSTAPDWSSYPTDLWHSITYVRTSAINIDVYVDGVFNTSVVAAATTAAPEQLLIGAIRNPGFFQFTTSALSDLRFYDNALNLTEVQNLYPRFPAAQYKLDETSGTTAGDSIGSIDGTLVGGVTVDQLGVDGRSYLFDGTTGHIDFPLTEFEFERDDAFTISAWVKNTGAGANRDIFSKQNASGQFEGIALQFNNTNTIGFNLISDLSNRLTINTISAAYADGNWHHVIVTYDGSSTAAGVTVYVDGISEALNVANDNLTATILLPAVPARVGTKNNSINFFQGNIDDVIIHALELTPVEALALYNSYDSTNASFLAQYKLDETSGLVAVDSRESIDGTISGGVTLNQAGVDGTSFLFDGVDGDINLGANFNFERTDQFTISAWLSSAVTGVNTDIFSHISGATQGYVFLLDSSGTLRFLARNNGSANSLDVSSTNSVDDGNFHHVVCTYDGSSTAAGAKLYIDGDLEVNTNITDTLVSSILTGADAYIGSRGPSVPAYHDGRMDDVRIYSQELSASEVTALYNSYDLVFPSFIHHYKLDETSGTTAVDSVSGVDGVIGAGVNINQPSSNALVSGTAFDFIGGTGPADVIEFPIEDHNWDLDQPFSVAFWVNIDTVPSFKFILGRYFLSGWYIGIDATDILYSMRQTDLAGQSRVSTPAGALQLGNWNHVVITSDGTHTAAGMKIYINNVQPALTTVFDDLVNPVVEQAGDIRSWIGGATSSPTACIDGKIDDVRYYLKELSSGEVSTLYTANNIDLQFLQAQYKLDETSGTTVIDSIAGVDGTSEGSVVINQVGPDGTSYLFDGVDDKILTVLGNFEFDTTDSFSITCWCKVPAGGSGILVTKNTGSPLSFRGYALSLSAGVLVATLDNVGSGSVIGIQKQTTLNIGDASFHHVAFTYDGSGVAAGLTLYIDGIPAATTTNRDDLAGGTILAPLKPLSIGNRHETDGGFQAWFTGHIDDVRIYSSELSGTDMLAIYNSYDLVNANVLAHYKLDETSGTTATDEISLINGTLSGGVALDQLGIDGRAYSFDGVDGIISFATTDFAFERTDKFSVSAWIKPDLLGTGRTILNKRLSTGTFRGYQFFLQTTNLLSMHLADNASNRIRVESVTSIPKDVWTHVIMTYDGSSTAAGVKLYINGVSDTLTIVQDNLAATILEGTIVSSIGARAVAPQSPFSGFIDDVRIYVEELDQSQVTLLFDDFETRDLSLLSHYKLDETSGTTALDSREFVNGTISGGVTLAQVGVDGTSFLFDGVDGEVNLGANFNFERTDQFTISVWLSSAVTGANTDIFSHISGTTQGYIFLIDSSGTLRFIARNNGSANSIDVSSTNSVNDGNFHHVVMTYSGSSTVSGIKLYIDGDLEVNTNITDTLVSSILTGVDAYIGSRGPGVASFHDGRMDDVRIYNSELSPSAVQNLYSQVIFSRYNLDESAGTTAVDSVSALNGTLSGGVTINQVGRILTSYLFDGVDDVVTMPVDNFRFEKDDSFTFSAWVKVVTPNTSNTIVSKRNETSFSGYDLIMNSDGSLQLRLVGSVILDRIEVTVAASASLIDGDFHLVSATYDGSSLASGAQIYVDSVKQTTVTVVDNLISSMALLAQPLKLGNSDTNLNPFKGFLDDARIYDGVLSTQQIEELFNVSGVIVIDPNDAIQIEWVQQTITGTPGTGDVSLSTAVAGFIRFQDDDRVSNLTVLNYVIEDGENRERGIGYYATAGDLFVRDTIQATLTAGVLAKNPALGLSLTSAAIIFTAALQ